MKLRIITKQLAFNLAEMFATKSILSPMVAKKKSWSPKSALRFSAFRLLLNFLTIKNCSKMQAKIVDRANYLNMVEQILFSLRLLTKLKLYCSCFSLKIFFYSDKNQHMTSTGIELATYALLARRSNQLS